MLQFPSSSFSLRLSASAAIFCRLRFAAFVGFGFIDDLAEEVRQV